MKYVCCRLHFATTVRICFAFCLFILISSCKKFVTPEGPIDKLETEMVFSSDKLATASVTGLYSRMVTGQLFFGSYPLTVYCGLSADELYPTTTNVLQNEFYNNQISISSTAISNNLWSRGYNYIYHANASIEGLTNSQSLTDSIKNQLVGEMKFVRAFVYFYLVNLFGDVPLILGTDFNQNSTIPRTDKNVVYDLIVKDLKDAKSLMSISYPSAGKVRPNKYAAASLLARVYLFREDWTNAELEAGFVIDSGLYSLVKDVKTIFSINNSEAIWQLMLVSTSQWVQETVDFLPTTLATSKPNIALQDSLFNSISPDSRKSNWIKSKTVSGKQYRYPSKYLIKSPAANTSEYITALRLAELYLIRSETRAQMNNLSGAKADIDVVRLRAGLSQTTASTKPLLLAAIMKERQIELLAEWGHRWLDLKRTNQAGPVLSGLKASWQDTDVLYPIPHSQILLNTNLTQNPGY